MGVESDPIEFLAWLLNSLHSDLKTQNNNDSIILRCFQVFSALLVFFYPFFYFTPFIIAFDIVHLSCANGVTMLNRVSWRL